MAKTFANIEEVKDWTDEEITEYLYQFWGCKSFDFIGKFIKNTQNTDKYCGKLEVFVNGKKIKYPQSKYPLHLNVRSYLDLSLGNYEFSCHLTDRSFREQTGNMFMLNLDENSINKISRFTDVNISKEGIMPHLFEAWGVDDSVFIGYYNQDKDGRYWIDDLRKPNFARIPYYPNDGLKKPISIPLGNHPLLDKRYKPVKVDNYYLMNWMIYGKNPQNPYEIRVDYSQGVRNIMPKWFIKELFDDRYNDKSKNSDSATGFLDTLSKQLSANDETFVYELLQNANDYPNGKEMVDVEFHITDKHLLFMHSGAVFNVRNISGICGLNEKEKTANKDAIGYKGIGFKTVFLHSHYVYIQTGDYSFRFDENAKELVRIGAPFQVLPIWTNPWQIDPDIRNVFDRADEKFRVKIALRPQDQAILHRTSNSFEKIFNGLFADSNVILFIPHINSVKVIVNGVETRNCTRDKDVWEIQDLTHDVDPNFREEINEAIKRGGTKIPEKYEDFTKTRISFACKKEGRKLKSIEDAKVYCYLPTKSNWGFPFLMNTDMIPVGDRSRIEDKAWLRGENSINFNYELASYAGEEFFKWIKRLIESKRFDYDSIFSLIPNFEKCKENHEDYKEFIILFQEGFEKHFLNEPIFPTSTGELVKIEDLIVDNILFMKDEAVLTDEEFKKFFTWENCYLPSNQLRNDSFNKIVNRYDESIQTTIEESDILDLVNKEAFQEWIKKQENNQRFLSYLLKKGFLSDFADKHIFLKEGDPANTYTAQSLYYNVDEIINAVDLFGSYISRLSIKTRENLEEDPKWIDKEKSIFRTFNADEFVCNVLLNDDNFEDVKLKLRNKDTSIAFFDFLTKNNVSYTSQLKQLPFFDTKDRVVDDFESSFVFFASQDGEDVKEALWFNSEWLNFVSSDYTKEGLNYLRNYLGVLDFSNEFIINNIIVPKEEKKGKNEKNSWGELYTKYVTVITNQKYIDAIKKRIQTDKDANIDFVSYCFKERDIIVKSLKTYPVVTTSYLFDDVNTNNQADYGLSNANNSHKRLAKIVLASNHVYFTGAIYEELSSKTWIGKDWMYALSDEYFKDKTEDETNDLKQFLNSRFGVKELKNEVFFDEIILSNLKDIKHAISQNVDCNLDFISFLDANYQYIFEEDRNNVDKFDTLPLIDNAGEIIYVQPKAVIKGETKEGIQTFFGAYFYSSALEDVMSLPWMQNNPVFMCNKSYGDSKALAAIGIKDYDFTDFFAHVIGSSDITYILSTLSTFDANKNFHDFLREHVSDLNQFAKIREKVPVYLLGQDTPSPICTGHKILSSAAKELFALGIVEVKDLDIIDPRYNPDKDSNYWTDKDRLNNKLFTVNHFVSWLKSNEEVISKKLSEKSINIKFWRWAKKNLKDSIKSLQALPVLAADDKVVPLTKSIYMSDMYIGSTGYEALVKSFDKDAPIISNAYFKEGDDAKEWLDFWSKLNVNNNEVDILRYTVLPKISEYKVDDLLKRFALHRSELEKEVPDLVSQLTLINLKSETGIYYPVKDIIYVDCEKGEPFKMVSLPNVVKLETADEKVLLGQILNKGVGKRITGLNDWRQLKIEKYINLQEANIDNIKSIHFSFIKELNELYSTDAAFLMGLSNTFDKIKLESKDGCFLIGKEITMGTAYKPYCDFEANGIDYKYLSEQYLLQCNRPQAFLRIMFGLHHNLENGDLHLMAESRSFALYIWGDYLTGNSSYAQSNIDHLKALIDKHLLDNLSCIPTGTTVKTPGELYSRRISNYVSKLNGYEELTPWKKIKNIQYNKDQKDNYLFDLLPFKKQLNFKDCLYDLFYFSKIEERKILLSWMCDQYLAEEDDLLISKYREDPNAMWLNVKSKPVHISELYALNPDSSILSQFFGTNPNIISSQYFDNDASKCEKICQILDITVIHETEVEIIPNVIDGINQTEYNAWFKELSLLIAGVESRNNWQTLFRNYKEKINCMKMIKCSSISMTYTKNDGISQDKKKFYHEKDDSNEFYYVDDYKSPKVYIDFVDSFKAFLGTELDKDILSDILLASKEELMLMFEDQTQLLEDEAFIHELVNYFPKFRNREKDKENGEEQIGPSTFDTFVPRDGGVDTGTTEVNRENEDCGQNPECAPLNKPTVQPSSGDTLHNRSVEQDSVDQGNSTPKEDRKNQSSGTERTSSNNAGHSAQQRYSSSENTRSNYTRSHHYNPGNYNPDTFKQRSFHIGKQDPTQLGVSEISQEDVTRLSEVLGRACNVDEIKDNNYLVRLRFYESAVRNGYEPEIDEKEFIEKSCSRLQTKTGYIHRCSARGGILYISPSIWNKLKDEKCTICMYYGKKANEFLYIHNQQELMDMIDKDAIVIQVTGNDKREIINRVYDDKTLENMSGNIYTLIRTIKAQGDEFLFGDFNPEDKFNNDDDFDPDAEW